MVDRVRARMSFELFVEDEPAMREAALQRLRDGWSGDEDFPYGEASDVPFDEVVNSLVADALPLEFAGCRRGQLTVETERQDENDESAASPDEAESQRQSEDEEPADKQS